MTQPRDQGAAPQVRFEHDADTARIVLDRPRAINALSVEMVTRITERVEAWADDESVAALEIRGEGDRGFCSGADVRQIRQLVLDDPPAAREFFHVEYTLDARLASFGKPVSAHLHGVSMGGGLGLALNATHVVAAPDLVLAMPETGIGLFPDVGATWNLAQAPGETGTWLALSGASIDAASARYMGLVHEVGGPDDQASGQGEEPSAVERDRVWIDECFAGDDPVAIVNALARHHDPAARQTAELVRSRSPWSVAVALEAVRGAARLPDVGAALARDLVLATNFVTDSDFVEGVRAQLVDKDRQPRWRHARLEDVPRELVLAMFEPGGAAQLAQKS